MTNAVAVAGSWDTLADNPDRYRSGTPMSVVDGPGDVDDTCEIGRSTRPAGFGGGLPVPALTAPVAQPTTYYTVTTVDARGRLADASPLRVLGWAPGRRLKVTMLPGALIAIAGPDGTLSVTRQGRLRLPADLRHALRVAGGDRVLVAADSDRGVLAVYTMATVDAMVSRYHTASGGASA
jgi:hypothetical protein